MTNRLPSFMHVSVWGFLGQEMKACLKTTLNCENNELSKGRAMVITVNINNSQ